MKERNHKIYVKTYFSSVLNPSLVLSGLHTPIYKHVTYCVTLSFHSESTWNRARAYYYITSFHLGGLEY